MVEKKNAAISARTMERGEIKNKEKYRLLGHKYKVKKKEVNVVLEELKQILPAKVTKIKRYDQRI